MYEFLCFQSLTLCSSFVRREDASISTGRRADVQVELDVVLQPEASSVFTPDEDGLLMLLTIVTEDINADKVSMKHELS